MGWFFPLAGLRQNSLALLDERLLPGCEAAMERSQKLQESLRQIALWVKCRRGAIHLKAHLGNITHGNSDHIKLDS